MATTYGYAGEFSSDEDVELQQNERYKSKVAAQGPEKLSKIQLEEIIATIKLTGSDDNIVLSDDVLAGLLDYFETQRGPIVDSTRALYKKLVLRKIRGEKQMSDKPQNGDGLVDSNGNVAAENNNHINNYLVDEQKQMTIDGSSDEDEPMPPASQVSVNYKGKNYRHTKDIANDIEPMDIDLEDANDKAEISSTTEGESEDAEPEDSSESGQESADEHADKAAISLKEKQINNSSRPSSKKATGPAISASKQVVAEEIKRKPYTRSQRVVVTRAGSSKTNQVHSSTSVASNRASVVADESRVTSSKWKAVLVLSVLMLLVGVVVKMTIERRTVQ